MHNPKPSSLLSDQVSYQLLVDSVKEYAIFMLDPAGHIISWNQGARRIKGYAAEEIIGQHFSCFYTAEDNMDGKPATNLHTALQEGKLEAEGWRLRKDGTRFWASVVITPLYDPDGHLAGYAKVTRDLSERKEAEEALRASEAKMRAIMDHAADGIIATDENAIIQSINSPGASLFGYTPSDLIGQSINLLIPAPAGPQHDDFIHRYRQTGESRVIDGPPREVTGQHRHGNVIPLELAISETQVAGQRTFIAVLHDMTFRKKLEDRLRAANETLEARVQERSAQWRAIFEHGPAGMAKIDLSGHWLEVNPKFCELVGYTAAELKQLTWQDLGSPADIAAATPLLQKLLAGDTHCYTREKVFNHKSGSTVEVESSLSIVRAPDGTPLYFIGVAMDISERKRAEAARRQSEAAFRSIFEQAAVGIAHANLAGKIIRANQKYADILGYPLSQIANMTVQSITYPEDLPRKLALRQQLVAGEIDSYVLEERLRRRDGRIAWIRLNVSLGREVGTGRPTHTIGIAEDITAQKMTEQALMESQHRLAVAARASGMGTWELDARSHLFWLSANTAEMIGLGAVEQKLALEDFIGRVHPDDRTRIENGLRSVLWEGIPHSADFRITLANGKDRWLSAAMQAIPDAFGHIIKFIGASMDISARKQAEQQLRQLSGHLQDVREDERKRLAREIHDELGGALTAIKFDLTLPSRHDDANPGKRQLRNQGTIAQVDAAIASLRRIISDLRPSVLDDLGLWAALEWQAHDFAGRTGMTCTYHLDGPEIEVAPEAAIALFRMVQEALTNVLRHAQASRVDIRARVTVQELAISIEDNGKGIPPDRLAGGHSYGLLGLQERARQLNGAVRISGQPGTGTLVRIWLPRSA